MKKDSESLISKIMQAALAAVILSGILFFAFHQVDYHWNWDGITPYRDQFIAGWWTTVWISTASLAVSTLIGLGAVLLQRSRFAVFRYLVRAYVEIIRTTPLLVQILIFYYIVAEAFQVRDRYLVGVLVLSLFTGAYLTEIFRSGIEGIPQTQWEAARALGMTPAQTYRYVILPQAFRLVLPPFTGQLVSLIKDSSLLSVIAIREFTLTAREVSSLSYSTLESYIPLAIGYLLLTFPLSMFARRLEKHFRHET